MRKKIEHLGSGTQAKVVPPHLKTPLLNTKTTVRETARGYGNRPTKSVNLPMSRGKAAPQGCYKDSNKETHRRASR